MRKLQLLKDLLTSACVRFTVFAVCLMILRILVSGGSADGSINMVSFLLLFPCGLCTAAASLLRRTKLSPALFRLLHFLITWMSVFLFLWLPAGRADSPARNLVALAVIAAVYWFCILIARLTVMRFRSFREEP